VFVVLCVVCSSLLLGWLFLGDEDDVQEEEYGGVGG
jgi:hypothetical protein